MLAFRLTTPGPCLFGLDSETWDAVRIALLDAEFISSTHDGRFGTQHGVQLR